MKNISIPSLLIGGAAGFIIGVLALGIFVNYLISNAISGAATTGLFLGSSVDQVREGIAKVNDQKKALAVYGHVVSIGSGTLVLSVFQLDGSKKDMTFTYDDHTTFVYLANDDASTPTPLSSDAIQAGDGLNISTNEAIGSVANQYAVKVTRI